MTFFGLFAKVFLIILNNDKGFTCSSIVQLALKILCRQCSEFTCANIINSTSVGLRFIFLYDPNKYSISWSDNARPNFWLAESNAALPFSSNGITVNALGL